MPQSDAGVRFLGLDWDAVQRIMDRAVRRGLQRRELEGLAHVGIDEKSFRSGQSYISLLTDLDGSRVLEVVEMRSRDGASPLGEPAGATRRGIEAVALDMAPAFIAASRAAVPQAALVHDKFHVASISTTPWTPCGGRNTRN